MKFFLSSASLMPLPKWLILILARLAGFDGVEFFLFGRWTEGKVRFIRWMAEFLNLELHYHQVCSPEESSDDKARTSSKILRLLGRIPKDGYTLEDTIPLNTWPLVIYADRIDEIRIGMWVKILSMGYETPCIRYNDFSLRWGQKKFDLVFDTMHYLEYKRGKSGVQSLLTLDQEDIFRDWRFAWIHYNLHVKEIHFNDFNPHSGEKFGRNMFPGDGIAPLQEFADLVKRSGWSGTIIPQVRNDELLFTPWRLWELNQKVRRMFS